MKRIHLIAAALLLAPAPSYAQSVAAGPNLSTLGVGGEIMIGLNRSFVIRLDGNYFETTAGRTLDDIRYNLGIRLASLGASIDYHPFRNGLMLSGGYYWNRSRLSLAAKPSQDVQIGNRTFTPAEVGSLSGRLEYKRFLPFIGIGYDNTFFTSGSWSFTVRAGVLILGDANVDLAADGALGQSPVLQTELRREEENLESSVGSVVIYPAVTIGLKLRF